MKKYTVSFLWTILLLVTVYFGYSITQNIYSSFSTEILYYVPKIALLSFFAGIAVAGLVYEFIVSGTSSSLKVYKRELEKGAIDKLESSSRIKVLESKIQVLEKALEEALKK